MELRILRRSATPAPFEAVERKGLGHPDTLADNLAEHLSRRYSAYTLDRFGHILHHNFDKLGLLGGAADVRLGYGQLTQPIRVLLNGRASITFGDVPIPVSDLLTEWATEFLLSELPLLRRVDLAFQNNLSAESSPGHTRATDGHPTGVRKHWFTPRSASDLPEVTRLSSNDTSMGVGFFPWTLLERFVIDVERSLQSLTFRASRPWVGSDIKLMGVRLEGAYRLTLCVPQIATHVSSLAEYHAHLEEVHDHVVASAARLGISDIDVHLNTRDDFRVPELYLTAVGTSLESGDEGMVGRGNRPQGFISATRLASLEGAAGKNPVYHVGKVYYLAAQRLSEALYDSFGLPNEVLLVSQSGRALLDPWVVVVQIPDSFATTDAIEALVRDHLTRLPALTAELVAGRATVC